MACMRVLSFGPELNCPITVVGHNKGRHVRLPKDNFVFSLA